MQIIGMSEEFERFRVATWLAHAGSYFLGPGTAEPALNIDLNRRRDLVYARVSVARAPDHSAARPSQIISDRQGY